MVVSIDEQNQSVHGEFLRQAFHGNWKDEKHYWISDPLHGFIPVSLADKETETEISIKLPDDSIKQVLKSRVLPANSARYDKHEDMAELGELNEATILHTLKSRYLSNLCYTYSGLFLIAINPYKELPIYNVRTMEWFKGQPKNDRPPHIYAVADVAYRDLLRSGLNQSILITYQCIYILIDHILKVERVELGRQKTQKRSFSIWLRSLEGNLVIWSKRSCPQIPSWSHLEMLKLSAIIIHPDL